jgi:hypothetical protein
MPSPDGSMERMNDVVPEVVRHVPSNSFEPASVDFLAGAEAQPTTAARTVSSRPTKNVDRVGMRDNELLIAPQPR